MTRTRLPLLLAVLAALVLALLPAHALANDAPAAARTPTLSFTESGCTEIAYTRGGLISAVRPLVPERFVLADYPGLPAGAPRRAELLVNEVTCDQGRFPGHGGRRGHYTYLIVSVFVTATKGDQRDGAYVLFYATENRAQRAALRRLGWPVTSLSRRTTAHLTRDTTGSPLGAALHVVGGGWDHELAAVATAPLPQPEESTAQFYRDTRTGPSTLCFANHAAATSASYSGDLRGTRFATVAFAPPVFTGYPGFLVVGGWDATVTSGPCPTSPAPALRALQHRSATGGGAGS